MGYQGTAFDRLSSQTIPRYNILTKSEYGLSNVYASVQFTW